MLRIFTVLPGQQEVPHIAKAMESYRLLYPLVQEWTPSTMSMITSNLVCLLTEGTMIMDFSVKGSLFETSHRKCENRIWEKSERWHSLLLVCLLTKPPHPSWFKQKCKSRRLSYPFLPIVPWVRWLFHAECLLISAIKRLQTMKCDTSVIHFDRWRLGVPYSGASAFFPCLTSQPGSFCE